MAGLVIDPEWRPEPIDAVVWGRSVPVRPLRTAVCGSYTKYEDMLEKDLSEFPECGVQVLSPKSARIDSVHDGFAHLQGDVSRNTRATEDGHLDAISKSDFVWIMNRDGYLGLSAAFEMGFAHAKGVPIFSRTKLANDPLGSYAEVAGRPRTVEKFLRQARTTKAFASTILLNPTLALSELAGHVDAMRVLIEAEGLPLSVSGAEKLRRLAREAQKLFGVFGA